jgi:Tat protein secretion system quality control protein TatD with DNase activity
MKLGMEVVTFKTVKSGFKSNRFKDIVLETDSPYLAPVPYRGENERK